MNAKQAINYYKCGCYNPLEIYYNNYELKRAVDQLADGFLDKDAPRKYQNIYNFLFYNLEGMPDLYFILKDFDDYIQAHKKAESDYKEPMVWWNKALINIAHSDIFSSHITVRKYDSEIWNLRGTNNEQIKGTLIFRVPCI